MGQRKLKAKQAERSSQKSAVIDLIRLRGGARKRPPCVGTCPSVMFSVIGVCYSRTTWQKRKVGLLLLRIPVNINAQTQVCCYLSEPSRSLPAARRRGHRPSVARGTRRREAAATEERQGEMFSTGTAAVYPGLREG